MDNHKGHKIKSKKTKNYQHHLFNKLKEPEIKIENKIGEHSLFSVIKNRKKDIEAIFNKIKIQNKEDLIYYEEYQKKRKRYYLTKSRNVFQKNEESSNNLSESSFKVKKQRRIIALSTGKKNNKSLNQTNISFKTCLSSTRERTYIINNYEDNSNVFVTNHREYSNEITTPFKTFEKNFHSNKSRNIRLCIGNNCLYQSTSPKKLIDFNSIDINKSNQNQNNQTLDGNNLMNITENFLKRRKSINKRFLEIEKKHDKIDFKLKEIINDWHFFPLVTSSFNNNVSDIIGKTIEIKRNGRYEMRRIHQNELYNKIFNNYWNYTNQKDNHSFFIEKQKRDLKNIRLKIRDDLLKAEKMKLDIKYKKHSSFNL